MDDGSRGYVHADGLLASIDGTETTYAMPDRPGSVRGLVDATETVVGTADYAAFGATRSQTGVSLPFGFTGEQTDVSTGNVFPRARYLSPTLGRFLSVDTVQPNAPGSQGYNLYGYVTNNPATWIDPTGHSGVATIASAFALIPPALAAIFCTGLCALVVFIVLVFLLVALILDCAVLGCDGFAPQREDLSEWIGDLVSPSSDGGPPPLGSPSADPGIPRVELVWPPLPNWQWDTPKSSGDSGIFESRYQNPPWSDLKPWRGKIKTNGLQGKDRRYYKQDRTHGDVEVYDRNYKHLGSMDPETGEMTKPPEKGSKVG